MLTTYLRNLLAVFAALLLVAGPAHPKDSPEQAKYREAARTHFEKRCKESAGEKIFRIVESVDSVLLMHPRAEPSEANLRDQYWSGIPYGLVLYPPAEITGYLSDLDDADIPTTRWTTRPGYTFVEVPRTDGTFTQYRSDPSANRQKSSVIVKEKRSRYAVVREDVSTREDRKFWVAGGRVRVIDLSTNELLGERIGYVFEAGFGSTTGARRPWLFAQRNACPPIPRNVPIDRLFVEKVLKPARESRHAR